MYILQCVPSLERIGVVIRAAPSITRPSIEGLVVVVFIAFCNIVGFIDNREQPVSPFFFGDDDSVGVSALARPQTEHGFFLKLTIALVQMKVCVFAWQQAIVLNRYVHHHFILVTSIRTDAVSYTHLTLPTKA